MIDYYGPDPYLDMLNEHPYTLCLAHVRKDGTLDKFVGQGRFDNLKDAIRKGRSVEERWSENGKYAVVAVSTSRTEKNGAPLIYWDARDDIMLDQYLECSPDRWANASFMRHPQSDKPTVYWDIDGTLGFWYPGNKGYEFPDEVLDLSVHYFRDIEPHYFAIRVAEELYKRGIDVCTLSAAALDTIRDKWLWVRENLSFLPPENIFFVPLGADKTFFVKGNAFISVLVDDYKPNLTRWSGVSIKAINNVNSHQTEFPEIDLGRPEKLLLKATPENLELFEQEVMKAADKIEAIVRSIKIPEDWKAIDVPNSDL